MREQPKLKIIFRDSSADKDPKKIIDELVEETLKKVLSKQSETVFNQQENQPP